MPANPFLSMNRHLQRAFAHGEPLIWHRPGGPVGGDALTGWYSAISEEVNADGFMVMSSKPKATVFIDDVLARDPSRAVRDVDELFRNNGSDTLTIGGKTYRVESCKHDGFNKVDLILLET
ncbi:hypothetical protein [Neorhizobium tomejilense]|uniref:hypothetical protein n=1 Tax=Neorhizobium tomejilense TaxID=2093828 RepID=UPI003ECDC771